MKRFFLILLLYILFIAVFALAFILIVYRPQIRWKLWEMPKGKLPVAVSVYERDKKQIEESYLNNLEYVRTHIDSSKDPENYYRGYVTWFSLKEKEYTASPFEARQTFEITVDTIVYDKTGLKCIAFIVIKEILIPHPDFEDNCEKNREYSARAMVGLRNRIEERMQMYPSNIFGAVGFESHRSAANAIEEYYYTELKGYPCPMGAPYGCKRYGENVGDSAFFENTPLFQKFDRNRFKDKYSIYFEDTLYNCQVFYASGAFYKYDYPY